MLITRRWATLLSLVHTCNVSA